MAEGGSREQFGALRKVLQPGEPAVCLPEAGGRTSGLARRRFHPESSGKGLQVTPRASAARGRGFERLTLARCLHRGWGAEGTGQRSYLESTKFLHLLSVDI